MNENQSQEEQPTSEIPPSSEDQKPEEKALQKGPPPIPDIPFTAEGTLDFRNFSDVVYYAKMMWRSGMFPQFKDPEQICIVFQTAHERKIHPMKLANNCYIIKGRLKVHSEFPKALVQDSGKMTFYKEYLIDKDYKELCLENKNLDAEPFAGVCTVRRRGSKEDITVTFTVNEARAANLLGNPKKEAWKSYTQRMLLSKARNFNLSYTFADVISGLSADEDVTSKPLYSVEEKPETHDDIDDAIQVLPGGAPNEDAS